MKNYLKIAVNSHIMIQYVIQALQDLIKDQLKERKKRERDKRTRTYERN